MMDWTDRHCRVFHRMLSRHARLYSEMVTAGAVLHGNRRQLLGFDPSEHPIALQLGGSEPRALALSARIGADFGYDEINLNVGCPSDRVQAGRFGAALMAQAALVARCVEAMRAGLGVPVTVKCRLGIDDQNPEDTLPRFIEEVAAAGCETFVVHARKAWLAGLSPKENREVPPLDHDLVYRIKAAFPRLTIVINGGIESLRDAKAHLHHLDGVMLGRAAYQNPSLLAQVDELLFGAGQSVDLVRAVQAYADYAERMRRDDGVPLRVTIKPLAGLFHGLPGARAWRRHLSEAGHRPGATGAVIREALDKLGGAPRFTEETRLYA